MVGVDRVEFLVIGAGPAGLACATRLAGAGAHALILDRATPQGPKIGESLPAALERLLRTLDLPLPSEAEHRRIGGTVSLWAGSLTRRDSVSEPEGPGWRVDRRAFEAQLEAAAARAGARRCQDLAHKVFRRNSGWMVETELGARINADYLIDASGRRAIAARAAGARPSKGPPLIAVWAIGRPCNGMPQTDRTLVESTVDGWWYGAWLPGEKPLAIFHTDPARARAMQGDGKEWRAALASTTLIQSHLPAESFEHASLRVSEARTRRLSAASGERWAAVGDAALALDPISSQGIFNALASADTVTKALLAGGGDHAITGYESRLNEIAAIYNRRRHAFYRDALHHHDHAFWSGQMETVGEQEVQAAPMK